jgi:hypothetical protein
VRCYQACGGARARLASRGLGADASRSATIQGRFIWMGDASTRPGRAAMGALPLQSV